MKRILALVLAVAMLLSAFVLPAAAAVGEAGEITLTSTPTMELSAVSYESLETYIVNKGALSGSLHAGDEFALKLSITNNADEPLNWSGGQFYIKYDSNAFELCTKTYSTAASDTPFGPIALEAPKQNKGFTYSGWTQQDRTDVPGSVQIVRSTGEAQKTLQKGESLTINYILFKVKAGAESSSYEFGFDSAPKSILAASEEVGKASKTVAGLDFSNIKSTVSVTGAAPTLASISVSPTSGVYGTAQTFNLTATSTSGKDITSLVDFTVKDASDNTAIFTIDKGMLSIGNNDAGTYTVTATPNAGACQGGEKTATFEITPATITNPTVTITGFGKGLLVADAAATADNMTVACGWYTGEGTLGEHNAASGKFAADSLYTLTLILTPNKNYKLADDMTVTVKGLGDDQVIEHASNPLIVKARTTAKDATKRASGTNLFADSSRYGNTLSSVNLTAEANKDGYLVVAYVDGKETTTKVPGKFEWKNPAEKVGNVGNNSHTVVFTPDKPFDELYVGFEAQVNVRVDKKVLNLDETKLIWSETNLPYTGEEQTVTATPTADIAEYVNVTYDNETEGHTNTAINAGSYTAAAVVTPKDVNNISLGGETEAEQNSRTITKSWTIANADLNPTTAAKNVRFGTNKTVVVTPADFGLDQNGVEITSAVVDSTADDRLILNAAISVDQRSVTFTLKDTSKTDADSKLSGTATLKFAAENYNETTGTTLTINIIDKESQTLTVTGPASFPYGTTEDAIKSALTITGLPTGATPEYRFSSTSSISTADPGSYTLTVSYEDDNNVYTGTYTFEITKLDLANAMITSSNTLTYNGTQQTQNVTVKYNGTLIDPAHYTVTNNTATNAGRYTLTVTANDDSTLYIGSKTYEFIILKAVPKTIDFSVKVPQNVTYNGQPHPATVAQTNPDLNMGGFTVSYVGIDGTVDAPVNAGEYTVSIKVNGNDNYAAVTVPADNNWKFTIAKATPTLEIETAANATYTGQPYNEANIKLTSASNVSVDTYLYYSDEECTVPASPVNAGLYYVKVKFNGNKNYKEVTSAKASFRITKASYDLRITEAKNAEYTGNPYNSANITVSPNLSVTFTYYSDAECTNALPTAPTEVGTYYVKANYAGAANYNEATSNAASFEITKVTLPVPPEIKVDGGDKKLSDLEAGMRAAMGGIGGTFEWYDSNGNKLESTTKIEANTEYRWKFIPADPNNYNSIEGKTTPYVRDDLSWLPGVLGGGSSFSFHDVTRFDYYYDSVKWAADNGIASGTSRFAFSPDAVCTRAQTVTFLWRAAGSPLPRYRVSPFTDVHSYDYYYEAVLWAVEQGITTGLTATTFGPDETVTRGQVATFLYRAASAAKPNTFNPFTDVKPTAYNYGAILWAYDNRITTGTSTTTFSPDAFCTRAQIVTFLYRYYQGR